MSVLSDGIYALEYKHPIDVALHYCTIILDIHITMTWKENCFNSRRVQVYSIFVVLIITITQQNSILDYHVILVWWHICPTIYIPHRCIFTVKVWSFPTEIWIEPTFSELLLSLCIHVFSTNTHEVNSIPTFFMNYHVIRGWWDT